MAGLIVVNVENRGDGDWVDGGDNANSEDLEVGGPLGAD